MEILILVAALIILGIVIGLALNIFWLAFGLVIYFIPTIIAAYKTPANSLDIFN